MKPHPDNFIAKAFPILFGMVLFLCIWTIVLSVVPPTHDRGCGNVSGPPSVDDFMRAPLGPELVSSPGPVLQVIPKRGPLQSPWAIVLILGAGIGLVCWWFAPLWQLWSLKRLHRSYLHDPRNSHVTYESWYYES